MDDFVQQNARAWDWEVDHHNIWTDGCTDEQIQKAKFGELDMVLSPFKRVRASWVEGIKGKKVLALACGGGQQAVLMSLAGAQVTVVDISKKQLDQDASYARTLGLPLKTVCRDMRDLSCFDDESFDLIYNPTSTCFINNVHPMYEHCYRILKPGCRLLTSLTNPILYMFDEKKALRNKLKIKYTIPYSDLKSLSKRELKHLIDRNDTVEFSHTLEDLLGGLTKVGFHIVDFYTDGSGFEMLDSFVNDCYLAVCAQKMA